MAGAGEIFAPPPPQQQPPAPKRTQRWWLMGAGLAATALLVVGLIPLLGAGKPETHGSRSGSEQAPSPAPPIGPGQLDKSAQEDQAHAQPPEDPEQIGRRALESFLAAPKEDLEDIEAALRHYDEIPRDTEVFLEAEREHQALRDAWLERLFDQADDLIDETECEPLDDLIERTRRLFPDIPAERNQKLDRRATKCARRAKRKAAQEHARDQKPGSSMNGAQRQQAIQQAAKQSRYSDVVKLCSSGLRNVPDKVKTSTLCGLAACRVKRKSLARYYHRKLPTERQSAVMQTCLKNGIDLGA